MREPYPTIIRQVGEIGGGRLVGHLTEGRRKRAAPLQPRTGCPSQLSSAFRIGLGEVRLQDPRLRREVFPRPSQAIRAGSQDDSAALVCRDGRRRIDLGGISVEVADRRHPVGLLLLRQTPTAGEVPAVGLGIVSPEFDRLGRRRRGRAVVGARRLDIALVKRHATAGQGEEGMASAGSGPSPAASVSRPFCRDRAPRYRSSGNLRGPRQRARRPCWRHRRPEANFAAKRALDSVPGRPPRWSAGAALRP